MPSKGEGFGLVYLEAIRWAKPYIGSYTDGACYIIRDVRTGLLVNNPDSASEVVSKIKWLLSHPDLTRDTGRAGYELVGTRYLFRHFSERFNADKGSFLHAC